MKHKMRIEDGWLTVHHLPAMSDIAAKVCFEFPSTFAFKAGVWLSHRINITMLPSTASLCPSLPVSLSLFHL